MSRSGHFSAARAEQLIGALVLDVRARKVVAPAPLPALPPPRPTRAEDALLDVARIDRSGRFSARGLLAALGWYPGQRLTMDVVRGVVVIRESKTSPAVVGPRSLVALPGATRQLCGLEVGCSVVLVASVTRARLLVHPAEAVAHLLADSTAGLLAGDDDEC